MTRALEERRFVGEAGGGMVSLHMNGLGRLLDFKVDGALAIHHVGAVEDLTLTAWNNAMLQVERATIEESQRALFRALEEASDSDGADQQPRHDDDDNDDDTTTPR